MSTRHPIRFLAPICILVTALYLAYWATTHGEKDGSAITTIQRQDPGR